MKKIISVLFILLLAACTEKEGEEIVRIQPEFKVSVIPRLNDLSGAVFSEYDCVGVYMVQAGTFQVIDGYGNIPYEINILGELKAIDKVIYSALKGSYWQSEKVDFVAYYPYNELFSSGWLDIARGDNSKAMNFMYAKSSSLDYDIANVELNFKSPLSKIILTVERDQSVEELDFSKVTVETGHIYTYAQFDMFEEKLKGKGFLGPIPAKPILFGSRYELYLFPDTVTENNPIHVYVKLNNEYKEYFKWSFPVGTVLEGNTTYEFTVNINSSGIDGWY